VVARSLDGPRDGTLVSVMQARRRHLVEPAKPVNLESPKGVHGHPGTSSLWVSSRSLYRSRAMPPLECTARRGWARTRDARGAADNHPHVLLRLTALPVAAARLRSACSC
jgi:hypothetical protein